MKPETREDMARVPVPPITLNGKPYALPLSLTGNVAQQLLNEMLQQDVNRKYLRALYNKAPGI